MTIVMELLHYLMRQLIDQGENLSEDQSYENFKQLLLRHAVHRPPHNLAILNLDEVKKIDLYTQDSFFRHFDMYKFTMTVKDEMFLKTTNVFSHKDPVIDKISEGKTIKHSDIKDFKEYFSQEEREAQAAEEEYLLHGPGKIERILNEEMERLAKDMETKILKQDDDFLNKMGVKK